MQNVPNVPNAPNAPNGCASRFWVAIRRRSNLPCVGAISIARSESPKNLTHTRAQSPNCQKHVFPLHCACMNARESF